MGPRVLTVRELAGICGCLRRQFYHLIREQKLLALRIGSDWRFNREEIERWMIHEQKRS